MPEPPPRRSDRRRTVRPPKKTPPVWRRVLERSGQVAIVCVLIGATYWIVQGALDNVRASVATVQCPACQARFEAWSVDSDDVRFCPSCGHRPDEEAGPPTDVARPVHVRSFE